jgi:hypothetical protein
MAFEFAHVIPQIVVAILKHTFELNGESLD